MLYDRVHTFSQTRLELFLDTLLLAGMNQAQCVESSSFTVLAWCRSAGEVWLDYTVAVLQRSLVDETESSSDVEFSPIACSS